MVTLPKVLLTLHNQDGLLVYLFFLVIVDDILVIYVMLHKFADGLKKKFGVALSQPLM